MGLIHLTRILTQVRILYTLTSRFDNSCSWVMGSALAYHNAQLEASAFREEFDPESFEDLTLPKVDVIHKVLLSLTSPPFSF